MGARVYDISILDLAIMLGLVAVVVIIHLRWSLSTLTPLYATCRMVIQLLLVGYVLGYIFGADNPVWVLLVLIIMLSAASWIALRPLKKRKSGVFWIVFTAIACGGLTVLALVSQVVLPLTPWYEPKYLIPLAGMIFSNSMNAVSLAGERFEVECERSDDVFAARGKSLQAALIPITNTLFAVGLVALPGMMTGQILSGVSPLLAVRYQIIVMCMIYGSAGISATCYLWLVTQEKK